MGTGLPTGTVTFLFTDIEGSTLLLRRLGERARHAFERHHHIIAEAIAAHQGVLIRTEGDAVFAVFRLAHEGVAAAVDAQRALQSEPWEEDGEVRVRMGLHTGEGAVSADDYYGLDVHRAARISAVGHGDQILISQPTRSLVAGMLPDEIGFRDLGEHRLKDLPQPERLYQVEHPALRRDFPPVRSLDVVPNNLPLQLTSFVGREQEVATITDMLSRHRLLTLTGPGGTGKTRLALQVAAEAIGDFEAVYFVPLAPITDPDLVAPTIVTTLGLAHTTDDPVAQLIDHLGSKRWLLVLDNFEQVLDAAPLVSHLLANAPHLSVLVTSRAPLHVAGEQEAPIPPLRTPKADDTVDIERLLNVSSVKLFVERASAARPDFRLDEGNAADIAEVASRLDGLPLAIELAAARIKLLPPKVLRQRLGDQLDLLSGSRRDLPERQRTLRGAISWSYELLDPDTRQLLAMLSVFRGGASLEAAEEVCREPDVFGGLEALVDHSLVNLQEVDGQPRFHLLETIRQFAFEQLTAMELDGEVRDRHLHYFCGLAEEASPNLTGFEQATWLNRLELERDNLRAALGWAVESGQAAAASRMVLAMWRFWHMRGPIREGRARLEEVLSMGSATTEDRMRALEAAGGIAYWQADMELASRWYQEALDMATEMGDEAKIAGAEYNLAFPLMFSGRADQGLALLERALARYEALGDRRGAANVRWGRGAAYQSQGVELEKARDDFLAALKDLKELDDVFMLGWAERMLGNVLLALGDPDEAEEHLRAALDIFTEAEDTSGLLLLLRDEVQLAFQRGDVERGLVLLGALEHHQKAAGLDLVKIGMNVIEETDDAIAGVGEERADELRRRGQELGLKDWVRLVMGAS